MSDSSRVTFIGHSTVLLRLGPLIVITDPNFSRRIWTLRRRDEPGMRPEDIHRLDVILISHGHYDHLDMRSLRRLPPDAVAIVPPGLEQFPRKAGITDVRTLRWWEETTVNDARITAVPAAHFPGRSPLTPRSLFQGYVVQADRTVYYAGDTGLFEAMSEIGRRFSLDLALLPIGAYNPWARYGHHMRPEDAIEAFRRVGARGSSCPSTGGRSSSPWSPWRSLPKGFVRRQDVPDGRTGCTSSDREKALSSLDLSRKQ